MARFCLLLDACALVPVAQADTLLRLAAEGLFRPLWSERILGETLHAVERVRPELKEDGRAAARIEQMRRHFDDAAVTGWEPLEASLRLPDQNDRHVLAAAIRGRADLLVTSNLADFPASALAAFDIEAHSPDEFLLNQLDLEPALVMRTLDGQARDARRPPLELEDVIAALERAGAVRFAAAARAQQWRAQRSTAQ